MLPFVEGLRRRSEEQMQRLNDAKERYKEKAANTVEELRSFKEQKYSQWKNTKEQRLAELKNMWQGGSVESKPTSTTDKIMAETIGDYFEKSTPLIETPSASLGMETTNGSSFIYRQKLPLLTALSCMVLLIIFLNGKLR